MDFIEFFLAMKFEAQLFILSNLLKSKYFFHLNKLIFRNSINWHFLLGELGSFCNNKITAPFRILVVGFLVKLPLYLLGKAITNKSTPWIGLSHGPYPWIFNLWKEGKKKRKKKRKKERKKHKPENCVHLGIFGTPPSFSKRIIEATVADNVKLSSDSD